ncbi:hypothetical protein KIN20_019526 [Parelaphostrongylus tenuis]|uniref:Uncharacterized protein n=1 Tax=Parelaphostrongylus tenuis TaxID=148309 RepID=A0AAD5N381_PARTN|nr:hypothetical protein KIN20_019526 [Parelaphostrongylus tenuis]
MAGNLSPNLAESLEIIKRIRHTDLPKNPDSRSCMASKDASKLRDMENQLTFYSDRLQRLICQTVLPLRVRRGLFKDRILLVTNTHRRIEKGCCHTQRKKEYDFDAKAKCGECDEVHIILNDGRPSIHAI